MIYFSLYETLTALLAMLVFGACFAVFEKTFKLSFRFVNCGFGLIKSSCKEKVDYLGILHFFSVLQSPTLI